jgi:hypothetical protein
MFRRYGYRRCHLYISSRELASHPVGTTVKAMNLFEKLPVRRQTAQKEASKTLKKIQKLLRAYVLAKPAIRLSLTVLRSKNRHPNFIYAPKVGAPAPATVEDAACKIIDRECVNRCFYIRKEIDEYGFEALVPNLGCDPRKVSGHGQYISIDNRPVSHSRRDLKKVCSIFKEVIQTHNSTFKDVKDICMCLNIKCPARTYDINVEPAKDDVLFLDSAQILTAVRAFYTSLYPASQQNTESPGQGSASCVESTLRADRRLILDNVPNSDSTLIPSSQTFVEEQNREPTLLSKTLDLESPVISNVFNQSQPIDQIHDDQDLQGLKSHPEMDLDGPNSASNWANTMYGYEEDGPPLATADHSQFQEDLEELRNANKSVETSNPWVLAKMAARQRPRHVTSISGPLAKASPARPQNLVMPSYSVPFSSQSSPAMGDEFSIPWDSPNHERLHNPGQTLSVPNRTPRQLNSSIQPYTASAPRNAPVHKPFKLPFGSGGQARHNPQHVQHKNQPSLEMKGKTFERPRAKCARPKPAPRMPAWTEDDGVPRFANVSDHQSPTQVHLSQIASRAPCHKNNSILHQEAIVDGSQISFPTNDTMIHHNEHFVSPTIVNYFRTLEVPSPDHQGKTIASRSSRTLLLNPTPPELQTTKLRAHIDITASQLRHASPTIMRDLPRWDCRRVWPPIVDILSSETQQWQHWACTIEVLLQRMNPAAHAVGGVQVAILTSLRTCVSLDSVDGEMERLEA